jgi:catechol 2,3-dioxygenase-like lactoylglutathione lyase family enzyme
MTNPDDGHGTADALVAFLPTTDLSASRGFYEGVLGLELVVDQSTCLIFRVSASGFLGVCEKDGSFVSDGVITTLVTDDVDAWCHRISGRGWVIDSGPEHSDVYGIYHAFLTDPSGNRLEIQRFDDPAWMTP